MAKTPQEAAFLDAIRERPDDDAHRLVYADWLDERGDGPRADLIRTQLKWEVAVRADPMLDDWHWETCRVTLSDAGDWGRGRSWLLSTLGDLPRITGRVGDADDGKGQIGEHGEEWAVGIAPMVEEYGLRRGLLERVRVTLPDLLRHGAELFRRAPTLLDLTMPTQYDQPDEDLARALSLPGLSRLTHLHLPGRVTGPSVAEALAAATHLGRLTSLWLEGCDIGDEGLALLAGSKHLGTLTELHLEGNRIGPSGLRALVRSPHLTRLRRLYLGDNPLGDEGGSLLAGWRRMKQLEVLDLNYTRLSGQGLLALSASAHGPQPTTLFLGNNNHLGPQEMQALSASRLLSRAAVLDLSDNHLDAGAAGALLRGVGRGTLRFLDLSDNHLDDEGLHTLAGGEALSGLEGLNLAANSFGAAGLQTLFSSPHLPQLRWLNLARCGISAAVATLALLGRPVSLGVSHLTLNDNELGDDGVEALARWDGLASVTALSLVEVGMGERGARALAASPHLDKLRELSAYSNRIGPRGKAAVKKRFGDAVNA